MDLGYQRMCRKDNQKLESKIVYSSIHLIATSAELFLLERYKQCILT